MGWVGIGVSSYGGFQLCFKFLCCGWGLILRVCGGYVIMLACERGGAWFFDRFNLNRMELCYESWRSTAWNGD